jgi:hypothetical protein
VHAENANVGPVQGLKGLSLNRPHARGVKQQTLHDPTSATNAQLAARLRGQADACTHRRKTLLTALAETRTTAAAVRVLREWDGPPEIRDAAISLIEDLASTRQDRL